MNKKGLVFFWMLVLIGGLCYAVVHDIQTQFPQLSKTLPGAITLDNAKISVGALNDWQQQVDVWAWKTYNSATPAQQEWMRKRINPAINKIAEGILGYAKAVDSWNKLNDATGAMNALASYNNILALYNDLVVLVKGGLK